MKFSRSWPLISFAIAIPVILSPFLFFGYSIAQGRTVSDLGHPYRNISGTGLADPAHSALLGQPYLAELKRELAHGRIPLLNMKNGLGAVAVESLLTCSFYILNPILLILPTSKPLYYDLFQILHICILLTGLYFLLRKYSSPFTSVVVALLITFSGVTYVYINLDIYRNFSWTPWMMLAAVNIARAQHVRRSAWLLSFAVIACITAGNVLESFMDLFAVFVVTACEFYAADKNWRPAAACIFLLSLLGATLAAMIAVLPYALSMHDGNLFVWNDPQRSIQPYDPAWLFSALLPTVAGYYPAHLVTQGGWRPHANLGTICIWLVLSGIILEAVRPNRDRKSRQFILCVVIPVVMLIGYAKIVNFPLTNFVQYIPFVSGIAFVKYHMYLYALASIPMAIGLESYTRLAPSERGFFITLSTASVAVLLVLMAVYLTARFHSPVPTILRIQLEAWAVSLAVWLAAAALCWRQPKCWKQAFVAMVILQGLVLVPPGFAKRLDRFPSASTNQSSTLRTLTRVDPNENLYTGTESVGLYEGVSNARYVQFMTTFFQVPNPLCIFEVANQSLNRSQMQALQLIGTEEIHGFPMTDPTGFSPLPRLYIISRTTYEKLRNIHLDLDSIREVVTLLHTDLASIPQPTSVERERTTFRTTIPSSPAAVLILNQAYSTYWKMGSRKPETFLNLFPAWPLSPEDTSPIISYWPTGLTYGLLFLLPAAILLFFMDRTARTHNKL